MFRLIFAIAFFLLLPVIAIGQMSAYAAVLINEILPKPTVEIEEWIELYNNGADTVSLSEWKLNGYTIPPGTTIAANGFATFNRSQTGIEMNNEGDTVKLYDSGSALVDSQNYPGVLGYNTSMGRSSDGAGTWTTCISWTKHLPNNCPAPTNTPTPLPTKLPSATHSPTHIPTLIPTTTHTPTPFFTQAGQPAKSQTLDMVETSTNSENINDKQRLFGIVSLCVAGLASLGLLWRRRNKK